MDINGIVSQLVYWGGTIVHEKLEKSQVVIDLNIDVRLSS